MVHLLHRLYGVDAPEPVDVIYLDFQKAFDKVPHVRLVNKWFNLEFLNTLLLCMSGVERSAESEHKGAQLLKKNLAFDYSGNAIFNSDMHFISEIF